MNWSTMRTESFVRSPRIGMQNAGISTSGREGMVPARRHVEHRPWDEARRKIAMNREAWDRWDMEQGSKERYLRSIRSKTRRTQELESSEQRWRDLERFTYYNQQLERSWRKRFGGEKRMPASIWSMFDGEEADEIPDNMKRVRDLKDTRRISRAAGRMKSSLEDYAIQELRSRVADFERLSSSSEEADLDAFHGSTVLDREYSRYAARSRSRVEDDERLRVRLGLKKPKMETNNRTRNESLPRRETKRQFLDIPFNGGWKDQDDSKMGRMLRTTLGELGKMLVENEGTAEMLFETESPTYTPSSAIVYQRTAAAATPRPPPRRSTNTKSRVPPEVRAKQKARAAEAAWAAFRGEAPAFVAGAVLGGKDIDW